MKRAFLFKRGKYYHYQYLDDNSHIKRISTQCTKKNDALEFVSNFKNSQEPKSTYILLSEMIKKYLEFLKQSYSKSYLAAVTIHLRRFREFTGDKALSTVTVRDIEGFLSELAGEGKLKPPKYFVSIKTFFNKAVSWDYLLYNPAAKIKLPKSPVKVPLFLSEGELMDIMNKETNDNLRDIYFTLFHTGMRLGELINMKWNQVNLSEKFIRISNTADFTTKGKTERTIPINEKLFVVISRRYPKLIDINQVRYVFTMNGRKYNGDYISKAFKKVVKKIKTIDQNIHLHSLRHSFASHLVQKGVSLFTVKELLGHENISTTQIYSHLTIDSLRIAVKALDS